MIYMFFTFWCRYLNNWKDVATSAFSEKQVGKFLFDVFKSFAN